MKSTAKGQNGKYFDNRLGLSLSKMSSGPNAYRISCIQEDETEATCQGQTAVKGKMRGILNLCE
jgi:hypothetical protein